MFSRLARPLCRHAVCVPSRALATEAIDSKVPYRPPRSSAKPILYTSVILNRAPILTPSPTVFERAFYAYQQRIRRALHNPFPTDFYFKPGSLLESHFNVEERYRERIAWGPNYVKDENVSAESKASEQSAFDQMAMQEQSDDRLMPRVHPADAARDYQSLDRKGRRNLYLLVRDVEDGKAAWGFPRGPAQDGELLHQAAQRHFLAKCGNHMDSWIVARKPIGMYKRQSPTPTPQDITFFFKAHIMAGQVHPGLSVKEFVWVTKQEIRTRVARDYWEGVKDMLSDH
ncbi:39S mitochondrial ribosomal protein L46-domain-containing protein [Mycena belliarum]|uniref:Large ribosomal subunit protein mL46 n=1 Tax=Mycena belliarum TaxID=1033014 RepID=A0AAD6XPQ4_9AGAR|nr:39S mitochondrial ribosomal protein L46-domain-containing protein [Mycena belliae]